MLTLACYDNIKKIRLHYFISTYPSKYWHQINTAFLHHAIYPVMFQYIPVEKEAGGLFRSA